MKYFEKCTHLRGAKLSNVSRKSFFQHDMYAGTSKDLFQNNKICTASCSKIFSVNVYICFRLMPLVKYCANVPLNVTLYSNKFEKFIKMFSPQCFL